MSKVFYPSPQDYNELEDYICGYSIEWYPTWPVTLEPSPKIETSSDYIILTGTSFNPCNPCENCPNKGKSNACFCTLPYIYYPGYVC
jgi:hypothetical protein